MRDFSTTSLQRLPHDVDLHFWVVREIGMICPSDVWTAMSITLLLITGSSAKVPTLLARGVVAKLGIFDAIIKAI